MLYTIIFILLVAVAALAVWVWELSCKFSLLNEDGMNCSSPLFRTHPQWQYHCEQIFSRLESLEESVFPDEEPYNPLFEISTFGRLPRHCPPVAFFNGITGKTKREETERQEYYEELQAIAEGEAECQEERTPQIVIWQENDGFWPIDLDKEEELKKTEEYKKVIEEKYPLFVSFWDGAIRGTFDFKFCDPPLSDAEKGELAKFAEDRPAYRQKDENGNVIYRVPEPGDEDYKQYLRAAEKRAPGSIFYENGVLSPMFFC